MAMSEALKIARLQARTQQMHDAIELVKVFAPAVELVAGYYAIDHMKPVGILANIDHQVLIAGLIGVVGWQAVGPSIPALVGGATAISGQITSGIVKALPALAAL